MKLLRIELVRGRRRDGQIRHLSITAARVPPLTLDDDDDDDDGWLAPRVAAAAAAGRLLEELELVAVRTASRCTDC